jgi:hypothetical protein
MQPETVRPFGTNRQRNRTWSKGKSLQDDIEIETRNDGSGVGAGLNEL